MSEHIHRHLFSDSECLTEKQMFDYIDHKLPVKERHHVEKHLLGCDMCSDAMEGLEMVKNRRRIASTAALVKETFGQNQQEKIIEKKAGKLIRMDYRVQLAIAAAVTVLVVSVFFLNDMMSVSSKEKMMADQIMPVTSSENNATEAPPPPPPPADMDSIEAATRNSGLVSKIQSNAKPDEAPPVQEEVAKGEANDMVAAEQEPVVNSTAPSGTLGNKPGKETTGGGLSFGVDNSKATDRDANAAREDLQKKDELKNKESEMQQRAVLSSNNKQLLEKSEADKLSKAANADERKKQDAEKARKEDAAKKAEKPSSVTTYSNASGTGATSAGTSTTSTKQPEPAKDKKAQETESRDTYYSSGKKSRSKFENKSYAPEYKKGKSSAAPKTSGESAETMKTNTTTNEGKGDMIMLDDESTAVKDAKVEEIYTIVEQMPTYPGGDTEMTKFIASNFKYPEEYKDKGFSGSVYVTFVVGKEGTISDAKVLRGISGAPLLDQEALRVVKLMPKWAPGKQMGKPVPVQYSLPIKISLK